MNKSISIIAILMVSNTFNVCVSAQSNFIGTQDLTKDFGKISFIDVSLSSDIDGDLSAKTRTSIKLDSNINKAVYYSVKNQFAGYGEYALPYHYFGKIFEIENKSFTPIKYGPLNPPGFSSIMKIQNDSILLNQTIDGEFVQIFPTFEILMNLEIGERTKKTLTIDGLIGIDSVIVYWSVDELFVNEQWEKHYTSVTLRYFKEGEIAENFSIFPRPIFKTTFYISQDIAYSDISGLGYENQIYGDTTFYAYATVANELATILPSQIELFPAYPNPFNPTTTVSFSLPQASFIKVSVQDLNGRTIVTLFAGNKSTGKHAISWNATGFSSGIYLLKLESGGQIVTRKITLLK